MYRASQFRLAGLRPTGGALQVSPTISKGSFPFVFNKLQQKTQKREQKTMSATAKNLNNSANLAAIVDVDGVLPDLPTDKEKELQAAKAELARLQEIVAKVTQKVHQSRMNEAFAIEKATKKANANAVKLLTAKVPDVKNEEAYHAWCMGH